MQAMGEAITRLNATIDEMRDVARLQVGQALDLQVEDLDVGAQVRAVAAKYSVEAGAPRVDVHAPAAVLVCGDRARLERVLHNTGKSRWRVQWARGRRSRSVSLALRMGVTTSDLSDRIGQGRMAPILGRIGPASHRRTRRSRGQCR
jgi:hypothetical protein